MGRGWASGGLLGPAGPAPWKPPFLRFPWCSLRSHRGPSRPPAPAAFPSWGQAPMLRTPQFLLHSHASRGKRRGRPLRGRTWPPKAPAAAGRWPTGCEPPQGTRLLGPFCMDKPSLRAKETARGLVASGGAGPEPRRSGRPGPTSLLGGTEPAAHSLGRPRLPAQGDAGRTPPPSWTRRRRTLASLAPPLHPSCGVGAPRRGLLAARPRHGACIGERS